VAGVDAAVEGLRAAGEATVVGVCTGEEARLLAADSRRSRAGSVRFVGVVSAMAPPGETGFILGPFG
jgi:hypothetical protein